MIGAVATADPAAAAAGNASLLSAGVTPPPATPGANPDTTPNSGNENKPVDPDTSPVTPPAENDPGAEPVKEDGPEEGEKAKGAPEQYEFTAPEGVTLDAAAVEAFAPVAKDLNLTQAQAQRVVDLYAGLQAQQAQAHAEQVQQWAVQVRDDPEIGGRHMVDMVEAANVALKRFGTPELNSALQATGLCNHPEMVRAWAKVGKAIADDGHVTGAPPAQPTDFATDFYSRMPKLEGAR